jgi:hypothetical protein
MIRERTSAGLAAARKAATTGRIDRRSLWLRRLHLHGKPLTVNIAVLWDRKRRLPRYAGAFSAILAASMRKLALRCQPD